MIEINAIKDTILRTANKYCNEDILVKVPITEDTSSENPATVNDVVSGKEFFVNGQKYVGNVIECTVDGYIGTRTGVYPQDSNSNISVDFMLPEDVLFRQGAYAVGLIPCSDFGTATPNDVAAGVTFTSASGLRVEGTAQIGGGFPSTITAGDTPVLFSSTMAHTCTSTTATATGISITVPRAGTYRFKFSCARTNTSDTFTAQLRKNGTAVSCATATWSSYQGSCTADISCNANDKIEIYSQSRGTSYRLITGQLIACIDWDTGF